MDNIEVSKIYENINKSLLNIVPHLPTTHYIIIERQLPENYQATRVAQHLLSYFIFHLQDKYLLPSICEIDPKAKGKLLGAPKGCNKNELKKWSVVKALELSEMRKDTLTINLLNKMKKKDDIADVLCQIEAFCKMVGLPLTKNAVQTEIKTDSMILNIIK